MSADLPQDYVRELFTYDPESGAVCWRNAAGRYGRIKAGTPAGCMCTGGYLQVNVEGRLRMLHRLAWIHANGEIQREMIDHIDGNRTNNRLSNLREATRSMNLQNLKRAKVGTKSGILGVWPTGSGWATAIRINNKQKHLGTFRTPELAYAVYIAAKRELHEGCTI